MAATDPERRAEIAAMGGRAGGRGRGPTVTTRRAVVAGWTGTLDELAALLGVSRRTLIRDRKRAAAEAKPA